MSNRRQNRPLFPKLHDEAKPPVHVDAWLALGVASSSVVLVGARGLSGFVETLPLLDIAFVIAMMALVHL